MESLRFIKDKYVFASVPSMTLVGERVEENRGKLISLFLKDLSLYGVLLKDLVSIGIKEDYRNLALNIAYYIIENEELYKIVNEKKDIPIIKISKTIRIKPDILEKISDYIIAYFIILSNSNYRFIQDYFRIKLKDENKVIDIATNKKQEIHKGIVIKSTKRTAYIITSKGEFLKIKTSNKIAIGSVCEGKLRKVFSNYKIHISIFLFILILICSGIIIEYRRTDSIIIIETTSTVKIHVNKFNKVIYIYSPTEKGKKLVSNTNVLNDDLDQAMLNIFEYAFDNQMIDLGKKTLITISGKPLKYGILDKTNKYIYENNIPIYINNSGNQQKLPNYKVEDEIENNS